MSQLCQTLSFLSVKSGWDLLRGVNEAICFTCRNGPAQRLTQLLSEDLVSSFSAHLRKSME